MGRYNTKCFSAIYNTVIRTLRGRVTDLTLLSAVKDWINDAQDLVSNEYEWPFLETKTSGYLSAGKGDYSLSGISINHLRPLSIRAWDTSGKVYKDLIIVKIKEADSWYPGLSATDRENQRDMPSRVFIFENKLNVQPIPDSTYIWWMRYYKSLSRMAAASAVSEVPWQMLETYGKWQGCSYYKDERANEFRSEFYGLMEYYYERLIGRDDSYMPGMAFMDGGKIMGTISNAEPWWERQ